MCKFVFNVDNSNAHIHVSFCFLKGKRSRRMHSNNPTNYLQFDTIVNIQTLWYMQSFRDGVQWLVFMLFVGALTLQYQFERISILTSESESTAVVGIPIG